MRDCIPYFIGRALERQGRAGVKGGERGYKRAYLGKGYSLRNLLPLDAREEQVASWEKVRHRANNWREGEGELPKEIRKEERQFDRGGWDQDHEQRRRGTKRRGKWVEQRVTSGE